MSLAPDRATQVNQKFTPLLPSSTVLKECAGKEKIARSQPVNVARLPNLQPYRMMTKQSGSFSSFLICFLLLLLNLLLSENGGIIRVAAGGKRRVHIPDELDDVIDDEEDEAWKEWGKRSTPSTDFDTPPTDFSGMEMPQIQAEMMKRHFGPTFGFVKLRLGVHRSADTVAEIAMKWTKVLRTGSVEAKFMGVDSNTIMFTMERGQDTAELKDFVLNQQEAYEMKIGDHVFRRPGDPPLEEVIEMLHNKKSNADNSNPDEQQYLKDEL